MHRSACEPALPADRPTPIHEFDVCVVGSANLDVVVTAARHPHPGETILGTGYHEHAGGKGLNQAVAAARSGATVAFVGALGTDAAGGRLREILGGDSIDASDVTEVDGPTGRAVIVVADDGENSIVVVPGANATVGVAGTLPDSAVVLCQLEIPLDTVASALEIAHERGSIIVLNPAPAASLPVRVLRLCDVITPNEHELELLGGVSALLDAGCGAVVVTRGGDGVDVHSAAGTTSFAAHSVVVVDTTGAGDAFSGSLACRLAAGDALLDAVAWANAAGALATTVAGAVPAQPRSAEIRAVLRSQHDR
ncbi:MAG: ribokinase [Ilumatobacteraceae bacterium]